MTILSMTKYIYESHGQDSETFTSMTQDTNTRRAIVTVDSLAAAFQHFNITHVTALEFFRFITQAKDKYDSEPSTAVPAGGAVIPVRVVCLSLFNHD